MKRIENIFFIITLTVIFSCSHNEGHFNISNESDFHIDSLSIAPDSNKQIVTIKKGESLDLDIKMNEVKSDGSYFISFKNSMTNEIVSKAFGYYTNGYQVEDKINIKILNDTILIKSKFYNSY
ncbi:hypothetical protein [Winogradskyella flava]|uniref:hypothetical protein n=1 Tax=Winogradskyella flava TaxID=1884876 RepID=UPI00248FCF87|nr:hypothetical protein [Winogradskyella flava]